MPVRQLLPLAAGIAAWSCSAAPVAPGPEAPLQLVKVVPLPGVLGRVDHLAYDAAGQRLFVAEIANGTVDIVDLATGKRSTIQGFHEPQGVGWIDRTHQFAVASADGTVKFFSGDAVRQTASVEIGDDADDVRVDSATGDLVIGYGSGALATIDSATHRVVGRLPLPAHPEGFSLAGRRAYINLPDAGRVVVADLQTGRLDSSWSTGLRRLNFPMALDAEANLLAIGFRLPASVVFVDPGSGTSRQTLGICGDTDDLYFDSPRARLYIVCGSGAVDVLRRCGDRYAREGRVATRPGARTGLFDPATDRLFVAAPARDGKPAAILVLRPTGAGTVTSACR